MQNQGNHTQIATNFKDIFSAINHIRTTISHGNTVLLCSHSELSLKPIQRILEEYSLNAEVIEKISQTKSGKVNVCKYFTKKSFSYKKSFFFTEESIFGKVVVSAKKRKDVAIKKQMLLANGFEKGDLVVHKKHGVAKFEGLVLIKTQDRQYDTARLVYAGGDILYVPIFNIDILAKYGTVPDGASIESLLDKLTGGNFGTRREKVRKNLLEIAHKLVEEAARRKSTEGSAFYENEITKKFDDQFLFALTDDQALAIEDCKSDLSSNRLMERLICGDVGFGKTEVAMRACALVTLNEGYKGQICVICPTTLLAQQHFKSFEARFHGFNVKIAKITRTTTAKERKFIIQQINCGEIDILIATHAGFSEEIKFKNLELLIIDEEQHFGVAQKEKMKERFACHVLLLSATPIPRTLQMGLSGIKDISIIATPPFDRILPQTQVMVFDSMVIANAIVREKERGGRTFFVCPRVADLEEQKTRILGITGGSISVGIAHGGMPPEDLENVMDKFYTGIYDVLVTTSIVESGIDISFANTMILYRSEMFGLAALYQLRGRVGRGKVQSYVYFIVKDIDRMTENAKQRLKAISSISSLGEGMKISLSDLDIRGSGNIVGKEQSGKMNDVGVELYEQMLKEAVMEVKNEVTVPEEECEIKINIPFFIPEDYIPDFSIRMQVYRQISDASSTEELAIIQDEILDRFGKIPEPISNLLEIIKVKIKAKRQGITKVEVGSKGVVLGFSPKFEKFDAILLAIQKQPKFVQLKSGSSILCVKEGENFLQKTNDILKWIEGLK
jgi:transcription-repair coupling factor (superfamily II helicase)